MIRAFVLLAFVVTCTFAGTAHADWVEAHGEARGTGSAGRDKALDDAFRKAVDSQAAAILGADYQKNAELVRKRIHRQARAYVTQFKVRSEEEAEGMYRVHVDADLAVPRLTADVKALTGPPPTPVVPPPVTSGAPQPRPTIALLAVTTDGQTVWSTFGQNSSIDGPVAAALERELAAQGFQVVRAPATSIPAVISPEGGSALPLDDGQAADIARQVGAGGAVIAAIEVKPTGRVRGTRSVLGAEVSMRLVIVDAMATSRVAEDKSHQAGYGDNVEGAVAMAAREASVRAGRSLGRRMQQHWPAPRAAPDGTVVNVRGVASWNDVLPLIKALAATPGVKGVRPLRFKRREVTLLVAGAAPVTALGSAIAAAGTVRQVSTSGKQVNVEVGGAAPLPPTTPIRSPH
jgi:hypothetical protein